VIDRALLVLVAPRPGTPRPPSLFPIGRAALRLRGEGWRVIFGERVIGGIASGLEAIDDGWIPVRNVPVQAAHDRLAGRDWDAAWLAAVDGLSGIPIGNPPSLKLLTRDKLLCQRALEAAGLRLPVAEGDPTRFADRLRTWGVGFIKPRRGSLGIGVGRVESGDDLERAGGPWLLQRAIEPPAGTAGVALRLLAQREADGSWLLNEPVARISEDDPVVNVERGAGVAPGSQYCSTRALESLEDQARRCCDVLVGAVGGSGAQVIELGLDFVLDPDGMPHLIEVNSVPRGRLKALTGLSPERWSHTHDEACLRPLRRLAALAARR
jgi:glutathione synthase/RimK-type ligase-like ATP-grasp enzyme